MMATSWRRHNGSHVAGWGGGGWGGMVGEGGAFHPGGGDSNMKMPGCVCQESENVPILNDTFSR